LDEAINHCFFVSWISCGRSNKDTLFFLIYGRDAILLQDLAFNLEVNGKNYQWKLVKERLKIMDKLIHQKENYQSKYKNYYDKSHKEIEFKIRDKCWVLFDVPSKSFLIPRFDGPFEIKNKINQVTYRVESEDVITTAHVSRMVKYESRSDLLDRK
jgi:hypothetical protein